MRRSWRQTWTPKAQSRWRTWMRAQEATPMTTPPGTRCRSALVADAGHGLQVHEPVRCCFGHDMTNRGCTTIAIQHLS